MAKISLEEKQDIILAHEKEIAHALAQNIIDKPILAWWMVLIPIFFIYYFYKFKKYTRALEDFQYNFLLSRRRALQEAIDSLTEKRKPNIRTLLENTANLPDKAQPSFQEWMEVLASHYRDIMASTGNTYERMIQGAYSTRANYLILCNRLNKTEKNYNQSLLPQIAGDMSALKAITNKISKELEEIRRKEARKIFA